jgi:DNA-binding NarL/FixJ family response regulator
MPIGIVIFEDNDRLRESLSYLISQSKVYEVLADCSSCKEAGTVVRVYKPDVVLMDIDMPGVNGIEGIKLVKEARPQTSVVMYTVFEDDQKLFQCLCAGANGYLLKKTPPQKLFEAILEVVEGGAPMSPSIASKVLHSFQQARSNLYNLTTREEEVLTLLTKGSTIKMIAEELHTTYETARSHLKNIYHKLHVNCGKEAIAKALKEKIV